MHGHDDHHSQHPQDSPNGDEEKARGVLQWIPSAYSDFLVIKIWNISSGEGLELNITLYNRYITNREPRSFSNRIPGKRVITARELARKRRNRLAMGFLIYNLCPGGLRVLVPCNQYNSAIKAGALTDRGRAVLGCMHQGEERAPFHVWLVTTRPLPLVRFCSDPFPAHYIPDHTGCQQKTTTIL